MKHVTYQDALAGFRAVGISPGDTVMLQSAMRPFGFVEGVYTPPRRVFATVGYRF